jgi:ABC-type oligopeptide transport system substrate-binding subunit
MSAHRNAAAQGGRMNLKNRWFLLLAGLLSIMLVVAAACGGDDDDEDGEQPSATEPSGDGDGAQAPADQQKLTVWFVEPQLLDPHRSSFEQDIGVERMIFRGLYNLQDDGSGGVKVEPGLAAGEPEINGSVYTVKLKPGLKWSDGEPLTAQHFVDGAKRGCDAAVAVDYGYLWGEGFLDLAGCQEAIANEDPAQKQTLIDAIGAKAIDDTTVEYTLKKPNGRFTTIMSLWVTFPARLDVIEAHGDQWTAPENIVTNGPFTLSAYTPGTSLVLKPDPNWTGKKPALQEITMVFQDDYSAAFRAYQAGDLDLARINAADIATAESQGLDEELIVVPGARITWLEMQLEKAPLDNFDVRLALSRAIDRDALNQAAFDGVQTPAHYWVVKGLKGHQGSEPFVDIVGFNPEEAKAALERAGYPNGEGFPELGVIVNTPERVAAATFLQAAFKEHLNINIRIDQVDSPTRSAAFRNETFELFIGGWQLDYPDIENPLFGLFETDGGNNHYNCSHPDVDGALERALAAADDDARIAAYMDMETAIVENLCGGAPLWQDSQPFLVNTKIGGLVANGTIDAGQPGNYCPECWFVKAE